MLCRRSHLKILYSPTHLPGGSNAVSTMHCIAVFRFESKHALLKAILGKALTIVRKAFLDINMIKASTDGNKINHAKKQVQVLRIFIFYMADAIM